MLHGYNLYARKTRQNYDRKKLKFISFNKYPVTNLNKKQLNHMHNIKSFVLIILTSNLNIY